MSDRRKIAAEAKKIVFVPLGKRGAQYRGK